MQSLRHSSRGVMAVTMRGVCIGSARTYCGETASRAHPRKSREERHELVRQFIEKYKAANNGQLPTRILVRKELGGKYEVLKEVFDNMEKGVDKDKPVARSAQVGKVEEETEESTPAVKASALKVSTSAEKVTKQVTNVVKEVKSAGEEPKKDQKVVSKVANSKESTDEGSGNEAPQLQRDEEREKAAPKSATMDEGSESGAPQLQKNKEREKAASKSAAIDGPMTAPEKLQSVTTFPELIIDDDDDDDSDVAAPEYDYRPKPQTEEDQRKVKMKENLIDKTQEVDSKNVLKRHSMHQAGKAKASSEVKAKDNKTGPDIANGVCQSMARVHERKAKDIIETGPAIADGVWQSMEEGSGKYFRPDFLSGHNKLQTSVIRIVNVPLGTKPEKIKSLCENVVNVHDVEMRRPRIADVHLNLKDPNQFHDILPRLRKVIYGSMKVFPAQRFSCGVGSKQFKPPNALQLKQAKEHIFHQFEQRFLNLRCQIQDYRQLLAMKREMPEGK